MAATYEAIATTALTSGTSYTFSSIPGTFTDLVLVTSFTVGSNLDLGIQFNGETTGTNYSQTYLQGNGTSTSSGRGSNQNQIYLDNTGTSTASNLYEFSVMNYTNPSYYKTVIGTCAVPSLGMQTISGTWRNTAAITSMRLLVGGGGFTSGIATLYGIKAA